MSKRGAGVQLTDRNWNDEEEPEEAGHFKVAADDQLSQRVIKKAKRRVPGSGETVNSFKGFQGFGIPQSSSTPTTNTSSSFTGFKGFGNHNEKKDGISVTSSDKTSDSAFYAQLKRLNQEVSDWIKKHINENPHVDLTPVFKDYEKHLMNLEKKFPAIESDVMVTAVVSSPGLSASTRASISTAGSPTVNGSTSSSSGQTNNLVQRSQDSEEADDTSKIQSQIKSTPEDGAFYSTRCKLFFKRDNDWAELGVGMLSLKNVDKKVQAVIRSETALGKILLNVFISQSTPASRSGKNNVLLVTVPNPPVFGKEGDNTKPVSYLIRVKTTENADELQKHLQTAKDSL